MATLLIAFPAPAGAEEKFKSFVAQVNARLDEHAMSRAQLGVTEEVCAFQDIPDGGKLFIVQFRGEQEVAQ